MTLLGGLAFSFLVLVIEMLVGGRRRRQQELNPMTKMTASVKTINTANIDFRISYRIFMRPPLNRQ